MGIQDDADGFTGDSSDLYLLWTLMGLFSAVSLAAGVEIIRNYLLFRLEPVLTSSTGWSFRKWFHFLIALSSALRACSIVAIIEWGDPVSDTKASWWNYVFRSLPGIVFFSTFSLLILFWAQLYYSAVMRESAQTARIVPFLEPAFFLVNGAIYITFASLALATYNNEGYKQFGVDCLYLLGVSYIVGALGCLVFGRKVAKQLSHGPSDPSQFPGKRLVLARVFSLGLLCTFVFIVRGVYCFLAIGLDLHYRPESVSPYQWDGIVYAVVELLPSIAVLFLTRQRQQRTVDDGGREYYNMEEEPRHSSTSFHFNVRA
eukprot:GFYU01001907.1.p1 GENE.GFYU01001907.1~~GFYU01001907.1.p1  ORF type:complete len:316 (-),score=45.48 GFYU01001907.1:501-1448(-)